jgi:hypothetical protein
MTESGERESGSADHGGGRTEEQAEDGGGLERDVGGEEVGDTDADENAEHERDTDPGDEVEGFAGVTAFKQEQAFEPGGTRKGASDGGGDAELDQEGDEDQFGVVRMHAFTLRV